MSTEQIEQNELNQTENAHAEVEAGTEAQDQAFNSDLEQLRTERDQLALQLTQAQDRLARLQAEFDNTRKREAKERQDVRDYAIQSAVEPFLASSTIFPSPSKPMAMSTSSAPASSSSSSRWTTLSAVSTFNL